MPRSTLPLEVPGALPGWAVLGSRPAPVARAATRVAARDRRTAPDVLPAAAAESCAAQVPHRAPDVTQSRSRRAGHNLRESLTASAAAARDREPQPAPGRPRR